MSILIKYMSVGKLTLSILFSRNSWLTLKKKNIQEKALPKKINNTKHKSLTNKHFAFFTFNHWTLAEVDECSSGLTECGPHSVCIDTAGSFLCHCISGYHRTYRNCTGNGFHRLYIQNKITLIRGAVLKWLKKNSLRCDWLTTFRWWCRPSSLLTFQAALIRPVQHLQ